MTIRAIISRAEAEARGLKRYFTGIPCSHGHMGERLVSNRGCLECSRVKRRARDKANPEPRRQAVKRWEERQRVIRAARPLSPRQQAFKSGTLRYSTGKPCPKGHSCERFTNNGGCVECGAEKAATWSKGKGHELRLASGRKYRAANVEIARERTKEWHQGNRDASRALTIARRATKKGAEGRYTKADVSALLAEQNNQCLCSTSFSETRHTIDHIVPLSRGGSNWPGNIQLLCGPCNTSKGTKLMCEWVVPDRRVAA